MNFYTKQVTPEEATRLLSLNEKNRKVSQRNIDFLAKQINQGNFINTGDNIKISDTGKLIDGQHRLMAIQKSGKTIELNFVEGIVDKAFEVIDTGKPRSSGDILSMNGYSYSGQLAATVRNIINITGKNLGRNKISNSIVIDFVKNNPELTDIVAHFHNKNNRTFRMIVTSGICACYWLMSRKNTAIADEFMEQYYTGVNIVDGSPIGVLRNKLINDSVSKSKLNLESKMSLMIVAWNLYRKQKTVKRIDVPETFPTAI